MAEFARLLEAFHAAMERDDVKSAESIASQCFSHVVEHQKKNPSDDFRLLDVAREHENAAHWEQAEAAYRQFLALAKTETNPAYAYRGHIDLSDLYRIRGKLDCALEEAKVAVEAARKTGIESLLINALIALTRCYLMKDDIASAATVAEEAVQLTPADKRYYLHRARALLMRARCRIEQHQVSEVQSDLDVAWELLMPKAGALFFAGVQGSLAQWWEVTARIRTESKDADGAAEAMGRAVELWQAVSGLPQLAGPHKNFWLADVLRRYSAALSAAGRVEAATKVFEESCAIREQIGIGDLGSGTT